MAGIEGLIPTGRLGHEVDALQSQSPERVISRVLDSAESWHTRRDGAYALAGRIPTYAMMPLLDLVRDKSIPTAIRIAVLDILSATDGPHHDALLSWLRLKRDTWPYRLDIAMLRARAFLADPTVATALVELAADQWSHRRAIGEAAMDVLIGRCGLSALFGRNSAEALLVSGNTPALRLLGVRLEYRSGRDILPALADSSTMVAHQAGQLLVTSDGSDARLVGMVQNRRPGYMWALAVLAMRGHPIQQMWEQLGSPRIALHGVPDDVREAIVCEYVPGTRDTDPRWICEAATLTPRYGFRRQSMRGREPPPHSIARLERAVSALKVAGLQPGPSEWVVDYHHQGTGTYHSIETTEGVVLLSTLGPFFWIADRGESRRKRSYGLVSWALAGFRHIDESLAEIIFTGLHVYHFGSREPLSVWDLLFWWQD